jgi:hypothetical protein
VCLGEAIPHGKELLFLRLVCPLDWPLAPVHGMRVMIVSSS